jgi:hypothetical protein
VEAALGAEVAALVSDMLSVRHVPERVELYDDEAARWVWSDMRAGEGSGWNGGSDLRKLKFTLKHGSTPLCIPVRPPTSSILRSAIRDWVLSAYDVRGAVLEVASRWAGLAHLGALPVYEQQLVALEAVQIYAPLAHALGLGALAAEMEDVAYQVGWVEGWSLWSGC